MWIHHTYRVTECSQKVHTKQPGINRIAQERLFVLCMTYTYTNVGRGYPNYIILFLNQPVYMLACSYDITATPFASLPAAKKNVNATHAILY